MTSEALKDVLRAIGSRIHQGAEEAGSVPHLPLDWPELDALLPDGGLPRAVVELASLAPIPHAYPGATSIALAALRATHRRDARAWCAWIDPESTLYAPGLVQAGVELDRLLVVRPPPDKAARVAVKVVSSAAFEVVAIDMTSLVHASQRKRAWPPEVLVRKLALAAEQTGCTVLLLTEPGGTGRAMPWPVAMRVEIERTEDALQVRIPKERRGRVALRKTEVPMRHVEREGLLVSA